MGLRVVHKDSEKIKRVGVGMMSSVNASDERRQHVTTESQCSGRVAGGMTGSTALSDQETT